MGFKLRKTIRTYRYKPRNIKIKNRAIALVTSIVLSVAGFVLVKNNNKNNGIDYTRVYETVDPNMGFDQQDLEQTPYITPIPTPEPTPLPTPTPEPINNGFNRADSVKITSEVSLRLGPSVESHKVGFMFKDSIVNRIITINGFDLVRYYDDLAFVSDQYTDPNVEDYNNEYYKVEEDTDVIRTTTEVYFRLGPSRNEKSICLLKANDELSVMGKYVSYTDPEDVWYLAKYKDKIGFVKAKYTISLKEKIKSMDPNITNVEIIKIGCANKFTWIYDENGSVIDGIDQYQLFKILDNRGSNYLVEYDNIIGFIPKENTNTFYGYFVVVDLSSQQVFLYCNADIVLEGKCTTGSDENPTFTGEFVVDERTNSRYFSEEAQAVVMWAGLRKGKGNGLHDAPWEPEKYFGSQSYRKRDGSKGCVRLPTGIAEYLKNYVRVGTKVLIKD